MDGRCPRTANISISTARKNKHNGNGIDLDKRVREVFRVDMYVVGEEERGIWTVRGGLVYHC
jgi:hypothetical protein